MPDSPDVLDAIFHLFRMVKRSHKHPQDLPRGSFRLLSVLLRHDGLRTVELATKLDIRPSSSSELVRRLEKNGYLKRMQDPADCRSFRLHATAKARREFDRHEAMRREQSQALSACLTPEEIDFFCQTCAKLAAHLKAQDIRPDEKPAATQEEDRP